MANIFSKELKSLIKERRSVRCFNGEKITKKNLIEIVEAGIWAPCGCNNQELRFLILDGDNAIEEFKKFKTFFKGVPAFILVFCDMSLPLSKRMYRGDGATRHLPYIDAGLAVSNMILFAKSAGIDSCVVNLSDRHLKQAGRGNFLSRYLEKIKRKANLYGLVKNSVKFYLANTLKLPAHLKVICGVAFGYADKYPDVNVEFHGGKKIMREDAVYYIIDKNRIQK